MPGATRSWRVRKSFPLGISQGLRPCQNLDFRLLASTISCCSKPPPVTAALGLWRRRSTIRDRSFEQCILAEGLKRLGMWSCAFSTSFRWGSISESCWTPADKYASITVVVSTEQFVPLVRCWNLTLYSLFCPPQFYCQWLNWLLISCQNTRNYEPLSLRLERGGTLLPCSVISGEGGSRFSVPAASCLWFRMCSQRQTVPLQIQSNRKEQRPKQEKPGSLCVYSQGVLGSLWGMMTYLRHSKTELQWYSGNSCTYSARPSNPGLTESHPGQSQTAVAEAICRL